MCFTQKRGGQWERKLLRDWWLSLDCDLGVKRGLFLTSPVHITCATKEQLCFRDQCLGSSSGPHASEGKLLLADLVSTSAGVASPLGLPAIMEGLPQSGESARAMQVRGKLP